MSQNGQTQFNNLPAGQTYFKNLPANAARFLKCV